MNIHWTITGPMMKRPGYLEEYLAFWQARPEVKRIWVSLYSPQQGEHTPEMLTMEERQRVARELPGLREAYPKLLMNPGIAQAIAGAAEKSAGMSVLENVDELLG